MAFGLLLLWISLLLSFSPVSSDPYEGQVQSLPDSQFQLGDEFYNSLATGGAGAVLTNEPSGPALVRYKWPLPSANQNPPNTIDQQAPQTSPVNAKPSLSFPSPNAAEWFNQGNEVVGPSVPASPPEKPSPPKAGQPSYKDWMSMPFSAIFDENLFFGPMAFQAENSVSYDKYWVPMRFTQMDFEMPPPPRPSRKILIRKSKNGYNRARLQQSKDAYRPDVEMQQMKDSKNFKPSPGKVMKPQDYRKA